MNYQPFLDMHILVSDDLLEALPPIIQAIGLVVLTTILAVIVFLWFQKNVQQYLSITACSCRSRVRQGYTLDKQANDCGQVHSWRQYE